MLLQCKFKILLVFKNIRIENVSKKEQYFLNANFTLTYKDASRVLEKVFPIASRAHFQLSVCLVVVLYSSLLT